MNDKIGNHRIAFFNEQFEFMTRNRLHHVIFFSVTCNLLLEIYRGIGDSITTNRSYCLENQASMCVSNV